MTTTPDCTHSFPDPYPQPMTQPGDCRNCGISYQEARATMTTAAELRTTADPEPKDEDNGPWCAAPRP